MLKPNTKYSGTTRLQLQVTSEYLQLLAKSHNTLYK